MNIINIERIEGHSINWNRRVMYPVKVTYKKWFQTKTMSLFPTDKGPTFGSGEIHYLYYADSLGEIFDNISDRINTYVRTNQ